MNSKLREALEAIDKNTDLLDIAENIAPKLHPSHSFVAVQIRKIVRAALAEPVKNCEVGTAKEQTIRFKKFCLDNRTENDFGCGECPCYSEDSDTDKCAILWSQLPYEEGEADEQK